MKRIPIPLPLELTLTMLKRGARFFSNIGVTLPGTIYLIARTCDRGPFQRLAGRLYNAALASTSMCFSRKLFTAYQQIEFARERNRARISRSPAMDPLLHAAITQTPHKDATRQQRRLAPGYYEGRFTDRGLTLDGFLRRGMLDTEVEVQINGRLVRSIKPAAAPLGLPIFVLHISPEALMHLPEKCDLVVRTSFGDPLLVGGAPSLRIELPPRKNVRPTFRSDILLDKKGFLVSDSQTTDVLQSGFLKIYDKAADFFRSRFNHDLFLLYGTLLGQRRLGDFIPGDDDFDVGYYSDATSSAQVRREGMQLVVELVRAGFVVYINRGGRLFRLSLPNMPPECHLDVHAVWRERGTLWIHPRANLDRDRNVFVPAQGAMLKDCRVLVPHQPDAFLSAYYGNDWRVPNPAYSTAARRFPRWKERHLRRSCITPRMFRQMKNLAAQSSTTGGKRGKLIAIGLESLYANAGAIGSQADDTLSQ